MLQRNFGDSALRLGMYIFINESAWDHLNLALIYFILLFDILFDAGLLRSAISHSELRRYIFFNFLFMLNCDRYFTSAAAEFRFADAVQHLTTVF